jgi:multicomponent Na+:H+ antiporter subunit D
LLNAAYFFPIVHRAFFREPRNLEGKKEASAFMVVPLVIMAILSLLFGLYPDLWLHFYQLATKIAANITGVVG